MTESTLKPHGENLRNAIAWLSQQEKINQAAIDKVSIMFDLTPVEEDFLIRKFLKKP